MITQSLLMMFLAPVNLLLNMLPDTGLRLPDNAIGAAQSTFDMVAYVLPIAAMLPIFGAIVSLRIIKIVIALVVRIKSFIPTMGA